MKQIENLQLVIDYLNVNNPSLAETVHEFIRANEVARIGRVNIFDFCSKEPYRGPICGVYYDEANRTACASDGRVLLATSVAYKDEYAGEIIDKRGKKIEGNYPDYIGVIKLFEQYKTKDFPYSKSDVREKIKTYQALHKIYPYFVNEDNTILTVTDKMGISIRVLKKMAKMDIDKMKIRIGNCKNSTEFHAVTYKDEESIAVFLPSSYNADDKKKIVKDNLCYYNVNL